MIVLQFFLSLLFWSYIQISVLVLYLVSFPAALLPRMGRGFLYFLVKCLIRVLFAICFIRVKVLGAENLPAEGRLVLIANHPGQIDPLYLIAYFPRRIRFVAEEKIFKIPLLGTVMKALGCIVSPKYKNEAFKLANSILASLRTNQPVLIYPENPRKRDEVIATFREGAIRIAKGCSTTLVPVIIKGSENVLPKGTLFVSPGKVKIYIDSPIQAEDIQDPAAFTPELEKRFKEIFEKI